MRFIEKLNLIDWHYSKKISLIFGLFLGMLGLGYYFYLNQLSQLLYLQKNKEQQLRHEIVFQQKIFADFENHCKSHQTKKTMVKIKNIPLNKIQLVGILENKNQKLAFLQAIKGIVEVVGVNDYFGLEYNHLIKINPDSIEFEVLLYRNGEKFKKKSSLKMLNEVPDRF